MATKADTSKPQEQAKQNRQGETGMVPTRSGAMTRPNGREPFSRLRDEFDRLFDRFTLGMFGVPAPQWASSNWGLDVREDDNSVTVRAEAPGFEASDFDIRVHGDRLAMCACHSSEEKDEGSRGWQRNEFSESVTLPSEVDAENVKAAYRNGVLTVTLPKTEQSKSRRIPVES